MTNSTEFDNPFEKMSLERNHCFLCGDLMNDVTEEHVFPKWLQNRFNLWNDRIELLNATQIPYRSYKIPCCGRCNREHLSRLENIVGTAIEKGYSAVRELTQLTLYQWAAKIFYGLLYKEVSLLVDRRNPEKGTIVPPDVIINFQTLHGLLQSVRRPVEFINGKPFSVLIAHLHELPNKRNYFFRDNFPCMTFSIQMGEVGIIVSFQDNSLTEEMYGKYLTSLQSQKMHPIQFDELYARVTYNSYLTIGADVITS